MVALLAGGGWAGLAVLDGKSLSNMMQMLLAPIVRNHQPSRSKHPKGGGKAGSISSGDSSRLVIDANV